MGSQSIGPDLGKVSAAVSFPTLTSPKQLQSFLRLCWYFRRFIRDFANVTEPLTCMLRKKSDLLVGSQLEKKHSIFKRALTLSRALAHFSSNIPTELHTDVRGYGIGAVLIQNHNGAERVVS